MKKKKPKNKNRFGIIEVTLYAHLEYWTQILSYQSFHLLHTSGQEKKPGID